MVTQEQMVEMAARAVEAAAKAEIEAGYILAMKSPRDENTCRIKIVMVCKNLQFAETAMYKKPLGRGQDKKEITGLSIRFAEEAIRLWKNIKTVQTVIYDDFRRRVMKVTVIDLESNVSYSRDITLEKVVERKTSSGRVVLSERLNSYGERVFTVVATEDEIFQKEAALVSKMIRTNALRLIPEHIRSEAEATIKSVVKSGIDQDPAAAKRKILDSFAKQGIMPENVEAYLGGSLEIVTKEQLLDLQGVYNLLKEGESTWKEIMERKLAEDAEIQPGPEKATLQPDPNTNLQDIALQTAVPMLPGETQFEYEERLDKLKASKKKGFKAGDQTTHQPVTQPTNAKAKE